MKKYFSLILLLVAGSCSLWGQESGFSAEKLPAVILQELNRFRTEKGLDTFEMVPLLKQAAEMSAADMADEESEKISGETSAKYLQAAGATSKGRELSNKAVISKGREDFKTSEVAKVIYTKWENNEKMVSALMEPKFELCGIACAMDEVGEKVYVSAFFGGYDISNDGIRYKKQLAVPYNTASKSLKAPDVRTCKSCNLFRNYDQLHSGLTVRDNKIFLFYPNARELRRILKKPTDGIAVDIVQRSQYQSAYYNIVDNNLFNKGVMSKVLYKEKFFKKNLLITKDKKANRKVKGIEVELGKLNPKITEPYELNLIIVQNGAVCKTVTRGYTEKVKVASNTPLGLLPMTYAGANKSPYEPRGESSILNFIIPFQKNKSEFQLADIEPFLKALNEPDFIIDGLYIYAYSSIEGDSAANAKLQQKRAESVLNVLQQRQEGSKINPTMMYRDSWGLFLLENEDGKYADIVNLGKKKAIERINSDKKLLDELEPILARERFAQIIMDVTYDLRGDKEQKFVAVSLHRALQGGNVQHANKMLDFIEKRVSEGKYPFEILDTVRIPQNDKMVAVANNLIWHKYNLSSQVDEDDAAQITQLLQLKPGEPALIYNDIFCKLKLDTTAADPARQAAVQQNIDQLYGKLDSSMVDGLNIEWQFRIMESADTLPNAEAIIDGCINRIRSFYNVSDASWQNAMKLASVFVKAKDYSTAAATLEPYLKKADVNEDLVYLYISCASRVKEKYYSRIFAQALDIARNKSPERYCKLFGEPYMTFQVLENPDVKRAYQLSCGSK